MRTWMSDFPTMSAKSRVLAPEVRQKLEALACEIPEQMHPLCRDLLLAFAEGRTSIHSPAYACNMVDSKLLPLVDCLVNTYSSGGIGYLRVFF